MCVLESKCCLPFSVRPSCSRHGLRKFSETVLRQPAPTVPTKLLKRRRAQPPELPKAGSAEILRRSVATRANFFHSKPFENHLNAEPPYVQVIHSGSYGFRTRSLGRRRKPRAPAHRQRIFCDEWLNRSFPKNKIQLQLASPTPEALPSTSPGTFRKNSARVAHHRRRIPS